MHTRPALDPVAPPAATLSPVAHPVGCQCPCYQRGYVRGLRDALDAGEVAPTSRPR